MNPPNQHHLRTSSTSASTSIRPRTRRLISVLDDEELQPSSAINSTANTAPTSPLISPFQSRAVSPIPSKHPSRTTSSQALHRLPNGSPKNRLIPPDRQAQSDQGISFAGLWNKSWTTLQELASETLGSDVREYDKDKSRRHRRPPEGAPRRVAGSAHPSRWGPSSSPESRIGAGSREGREALVRAKKREELLAANGDAFADAVGRIKRRTSDDRGSMSAPPVESDDRDALVYVHHVRKEDTLAGISIKYNCPVSIIRKANRMWPNNTIQAWKVILLPVDACGIKGKPVPSMQEEELLGEALDGVSTLPTISLPDGARSQRQKDSLFTPTTSPPLSSVATSEHNDDSPWKHESWVTLDGQSTATEIARLPRRELGYFPPARRKSVSYSDLDTPAASLELSRPSSLEYTPAQRRVPPQRRTRRSSASQFAKHLQGPGGVGMLGRNVNSPGPAQDLLNKLFPNAAPQGNSEGDLLTGMHTLENVGGAIEGWMRNLATRATSLVEVSPKRAAAAGDLIELQSDPFEVGEDEHEEGHGSEPADDWERGRRVIGTAHGSRGNSSMGLGMPRSGRYEEDRGKKKGE